MSHDSLNSPGKPEAHPSPDGVATTADTACGDEGSGPAASLAADLAKLAAESEVIAVCGLPAVGKTFLTAALGDYFAREGRNVSMLGWDPVRIRMETVHASKAESPQASELVRRLAGLWARREVGRWARQRSPGDRLIIEAPLIGHRFSELARVDDDPAEPLLARASFIIPVPTPQTRNRIIGMRQVDHGANGPRPQDAPLSVIERIWEEMRVAAQTLQITDAEGYSPDLYRQVYLHALAYRTAHPVTVDRLHTLPAGRAPTVREHVPSSEEVLALARDAGESLWRTVPAWYAPEPPEA